jgi:hypothetical protein
MYNQPGIVKDNPLTRMIEAGKQANIERGAVAGRSVGTPMTTLPRVRSQPMMVSPLTVDEIAEADRRAVELGILSEDEVDPAHLIPREDSVVPIKDGHSLPLYPTPHQTAREFLPPTPPRMLDFNKVEGLDLVEGKAIVDGFYLDLPSSDVKKLRKYVLELAVDYMTRKLAEAMNNLEPETNEEPVIEEAETEEVQRIPEGDSETIEE